MQLLHSNKVLHVWTRCRPSPQTKYSALHHVPHRGSHLCRLVYQDLVQNKDLAAQLPVTLYRDMKH